MNREAAESSQISVDPKRRLPSFLRCIVCAKALINRDGNHICIACAQQLLGPRFDVCKREQETAMYTPEQIARLTAP